MTASLRINTNGQTLIVDVQAPGSATEAFFSDLALTQSVTFPLSVTSDTTIYTANDGDYTVSCKQPDGTELAGTVRRIHSDVPTVVEPVPSAIQAGADLGLVSGWPLVTKIATMDRGRTSFADGNAATSGTLFLNYFTATDTLAVDQMEIHTGGTAAAATPTLCRLGIFEENAAYGISAPVASTANDTTLFASTNTKYTKALTAEYTIKRGQRYAFGVLVVSGAAVPTFVGRSQYGQTFVDNLLAENYRVCGSVTGLTDLPAAVTATGSIASSRRNYYIAASHS